MKHTLAILLLTASVVFGQFTNITGDGINNNATFRNAVLPVQTSQSGKYLKTDGTNATWETASGATVDNAAVNAAIATSPLATRTALNSPEQNQSLRGLHNSINLISSQGDAPVSAILIGDSFAATGNLFSFSTIVRVVGAYRCGTFTGGGDSGVTTVEDYTKSPSGRYSSVASGGNLTCAHQTTGNQGPASHAYYTFFTGTGTAQIQSKKGAGAWTNVGSAIDTTAITTVSIGTVALADTSSNYAIRVTATGGTVNGWIGQGLNGPGLTVVNFATAGQGIEQSATVTEAIWKAMVEGYKASGGAQLVISAFADYRFTAVATSAWPTKGTPSWNASGPAQTLHDWSRAQNSLIDWVIVGPHQVNTASNDLAEALVDAAFTAIGIGSNLNARTMDGSRAQREFAERNSTAWADCSVLTDYAKGNAAGMYVDDVHFSLRGQDYKRAHMFTQTNLGWVLGASQQYSSLRIGGVRLSATSTRSTASSVIAYLSTLSDSQLAPFTGSSMRAGDAVNPEQAGMEFAWQSTNEARIRSYSAGGPNSAAVVITYSGAGIVLKPSVTSTSRLGDTSTPWDWFFLDKTITAPATTGARTIDKQSGRVNFAAAATSLVVTSARVTANSIIIATVATNDTTMKSVSAVAAAGSFTLHADAAPTAETAVNFLITN